MKKILPAKVEENRVAGPRNTRSGACILKCGSAKLRIIFSDGMGWDHVSVSLATRCPTWEEMCWVKDVFFDDHEVVMQLHPAKSNYVNQHPFCLHLWRPQSTEYMEQLRQEWGGEWNNEWQSPGAIPLPQLVQV
jgi:hypothetical protein